MKNLEKNARPPELETLGFLEVLDQDPRPSFILDRSCDHESETPSKNSLRPVFCNRALLSQPSLSNAFSSPPRKISDASTANAEHVNFMLWANGPRAFNPKEGRIQPIFNYRRHIWTSFSVNDRWTIVCANHSAGITDPQDSDAQSHEPSNTIIPVTTSKQKPGIGRQSSNQHIARDDEVLSDHRNTEFDSDGMKSGSAKDKSSEDDESSSGSLSSSLSSSDGHTDLDPMLVLSMPEKGVPDCTAEVLKGTPSSHVLFFRSIDWAGTALGPMSAWSREFRQVINLMMGNPHPAALFWGNELTMLYNEAYAVEVAGNKHPVLLGTGFAGPFKELWEGVRPLFAECARTGTSIRKDNNVLFMERHGFMEETYFSWSWTPIYGSGLRILGFYNAPFETTAYCVGQRRTRTLQKLNSLLSTAKTVSDFWQCVLDALEGNPFDLPFVLLYSIEGSSDGENANQGTVSTPAGSVPLTCSLEGSIGIPKGHALAPRELDLQSSEDSGWVQSFRNAIRTREPTMLQTYNQSLPEHLMNDLKWRGFGDPCKEAVILPLRPTNSDSILSVLVFGCNPRRRYDTEYKAFTELMNRQLATSLASILLFEEETRRSKIAIEAATFEQEQLNRQLAVQTDRLKRMTELSPLGMFNVDPAGLVLEGNDRYFEMISQNRDQVFGMSWLNTIAEDSRAVMTKGWKNLTEELQPFSAELHLNKKCVDPTNPGAEPIDYWVLANASPELTPDGKLKSVMGSITDISHIKWAQGLQDRRLREAEETRRQQNDFIDITSHEMRNPMSAVLQCADDIAMSLTDCRNNSLESAATIIDDCIELASTITLCVQHQKSIVDDILTVSKLDSNLVVLTPVPVQPIHVIRQILKVFEPEFVSKRINFELKIHESYDAAGMDWILMDASRVSQIVINFMTNAIKFTSGRDKRHIKMYMGASKDPPVPTTPNFQYIPRKHLKPSSFVEDSLMSGETVHLRIKVEDTGCGLTENEKQLLFQRFQQASPRTHAQYGGSGLGLFISRQLTELHGGQIGVASVADEGSTFGFFIKARRTDPPETNIHLPSSISHYPALHDPKAHASQRNGHADSTSSDTGSTTANISIRAKSPVMTLLVVEDNLVNQKVLTKQLCKAGYAVEVADNGKLALDYLRTTSFCKNDGSPLTAVLMDLEMPIMDGLTCVREIRKWQARGFVKSHVPIIAITANVRKEQIEGAISSGVDDVVSKPFRIPDVLTKIKALLERLELSSNNTREASNR